MVRLRETRAQPNAHANSRRRVRRPNLRRNHSVDPKSKFAKWFASACNECYNSLLPSAHWSELLDIDNFIYAVLERIPATGRIYDKGLDDFGDHGTRTQSQLATSGTVLARPKAPQGMKPNYVCQPAPFHPSPHHPLPSPPTPPIPPFLSCPSNNPLLQSPSSFRC